MSPVYAEPEADSHASGSSVSRDDTSNEPQGAQRPEDRARLDKNAKSVGSGQGPQGRDKARSARSQRWDARGFLWKESTLNRVRKCGRVTVGPEGYVQVRHDQDSGTAGFSGLATCGSIWACPVCSAKIEAERREELADGQAGAAERGWQVAFLTITARHHKGDRLDTLWDRLTEVSRAIQQDKTVRDYHQDYGLIGHITRREVTHGANGWHPHIHRILFFDGSTEITQDHLDELMDEYMRVMVTASARVGLSKPMRSAQDLQLVDTGAERLADYLAKSDYDPSKMRSAQSVGFEMTSTHTKSGRKGSRTPWEILDSARLNGDADDLELWHEYEAATSGKRALVWSRGLKKMLSIGEKDDDDIVKQDHGGEQVLTIADWSPVQRMPFLGAALLDAVEIGGVQAGIDFCDDNLIPWLLMVDVDKDDGSGDDYQSWGTQG